MRVLIILAAVSCVAAAAGYESYQTPSYPKQSDSSIYGKYEDNTATEKDNILNEYEYDKKHKGKSGQRGSQGPLCYEVLYSPPYPKENSDITNQQNRFLNHPPYVWAYKSVGDHIGYNTPYGGGILSKAPSYNPFTAYLSHMTGPKSYDGNTKDGAFWEMVFTHPNPLKILGVASNFGHEEKKGYGGGGAGHSAGSMSMSSDFGIGSAVHGGHKGGFHHKAGHKGEIHHKPGHHGGSPGWVTSYLVQADDELVEPLEAAKGTKVFKGNFDGVSTWYNYFKHPISPYSLRFYPLTGSDKHKNGIRFAVVVQKCVGDDITEILNTKNGYPGRNADDFGTHHPHHKVV